MGGEQPIRREGTNTAARGRLITGTCAFSFFLFSKAPLPFLVSVCLSLSSPLVRAAVILGESEGRNDEKKENKAEHSLVTPSPLKA